MVDGQGGLRVVRPVALEHKPALVLALLRSSEALHVRVQIRKHATLSHVQSTARVLHPRSIITVRQGLR